MKAVFLFLWEGKEGKRKKFCRASIDFSIGACGETFFVERFFWRVGFFTHWFYLLIHAYAFITVLLADFWEFAKAYSLQITFQLSNALTLKCHWLLISHPQLIYYKDLNTVKSETLITEFNINVANNPLRYFTNKGMTLCIKVYFGNKFN